MKILEVKILTRYADCYKHFWFPTKGKMIFEKYSSHEIAMGSIWNYQLWWIWKSKWWVLAHDNSDPNIFKSTENVCTLYRDRSLGFSLDHNGRAANGTS